MSANKKNILVLTYWSYNSALIQTYTLPYVKILTKYLSQHYKVILVTLDKDTPIISNEIDGFNIINLSFSYKSFGFQGLLMWIKLIFKLFYIIKKENIEIIHTWCTPAGALGYILSELSNKKLIIDSFEPHAIPMIESGTWSKNGLAFKILFNLEKRQLKRASEVICANEAMIKYSKELYKIKKQRYFYKPACVDLNLFSKNKLKSTELLKSLNLEDKIICVYAGKFGGLYLENETFDFFKTAINFWGDKFRVLLLTNHSDKEIYSYLRKANIESKYLVKKFVSHIEIPNYIGLADFAFTPIKPIPSKRFSAPIKNGEYWAMGLPVVITKNISDDSEIIMKYEIGSVLDDLSYNSYLKSIIEIDELLKKFTKEELYNKIRPIAEKYRNFSIAEQVYKEIYG